MSIICQGLLFGKLEKRFGESPLVIVGCIIMTITLFVIPFVGPETGGLVALLLIGAFLSIGNSLASPALTSLVSRISSEEEQGKALGIMQSGASLARAIAPMIGGVLLNNALGSLDVSRSAEHSLLRRDNVLAIVVSVLMHRTLRTRKKWRPVN